MKIRIEKHFKLLFFRASKIYFATASLLLVGGSFLGTEIGMGTFFFCFPSIP
jgi:hypothetical protein